MSDVYERAKQECEIQKRRIIKLEQQLDAAKAKMDRAVTFITGWEHFTGLTAAKDDAKERRAPESPAPTARKKPFLQFANPTKEEVARLAVDTLLAAGRPLTRAELFKALTDKGLILHGKDPIVVLSTMLWRMNKVVAAVKGLGYWPIGHPMPGKQVLNGVVVKDHVVTDCDTTTAVINEAARVLYGSDEDVHARVHERLSQ